MMRNCLLLFLIAVCGCDSTPAVRPVKPPPLEVPAANLPRPLREWNWTDRNGAGSCVIASSVYHLRWQDKLSIADRLRRTYAGGQTATSIRNIWTREGIPHVYTEAGDPAFLDWASRTRRGAIIWYFPSHCVHFCGFSMVDGQEFAVLNDNNRIDGMIKIPRSEFLRNWRGYGGFACTALFAPSPPLPWPAYEPEPRK